MLSPQIRLNASRKTDLARVCELGAKKLDQVASKIESGFTIRRSQIEETIQEIIGQDDGKILTSVLFGVAGSFRRFSVSADDALERITQILASDLKDNPKFAEWEECRACLKRMMETQSVSLAAKALDISYDFERVYISGRLLTSIRPIFDESRQDIRGATIVQTLRLESASPDGDQVSISVAMDMSDIRRLQEECERAIKKAEIAQARFEKDCGFDAIIPGEEDDD